MNGQRRSCSSLSRRAALQLLTVRVVTAAAAPAPLRVPVRRIMDSRAGFTPQQLHSFWWQIWPEAVRTFSGCGVELAASDAPGEIRRSPSGQLIFAGVEHGVINLVVTKQIPLGWARGRGVAGVTTLWNGHHVCVIALDHAHVNRVPLLAVNTVVHELLHALFQDVFIVRPTWAQSEQHELRVNWAATRLWLLHDGSGVRQSAATYLTRLRSGSVREGGP